MNTNNERITAIMDELNTEQTDELLDGVEDSAKVSAGRRNRIKNSTLLKIEFGAIGAIGEIEESCEYVPAPRRRSLLRQLAPMAAGLLLVAVGAVCMLHFLAPDDVADTGAGGGCSDYTSARHSTPATPSDVQLLQPPLYMGLTGDWNGRIHRVHRADVLADDWWGAGWHQITSAEELSLFWEEKRLWLILDEPHDAALSAQYAIAPYYHPYCPTLPDENFFEDRFLIVVVLGANSFVDFEPLTLLEQGDTLFIKVMSLESPAMYYHVAIFEVCRRYVEHDIQILDVPECVVCNRGTDCCICESFTIEPPHPTVYTRV
jgi:hypothetical protein